MESLYELRPIAKSDLVQQRQRDILLEAITNYISWRDNKDSPDTRGYEVTIFTWLRHHTKFGRNRAIDLRHALNSNRALSNPIRVLQKHFKKDSKLNNHSLDTYLLESISKNRPLFLISKNVSELNTLEAREELQKIIMHQDLHSDEDYAFGIGSLYEDELDTPDNLKKASMYYAIAMRGKHKQSYLALKKLAKKGVSDAQYYIGSQYYHPKSKFNQAIKWCLLAAEQHHLKANTYLTTTKFSVEEYLHIAKKYEYGDGVNKNLISAILFYEKACALDNIEAALFLGQLYQPTLEIAESSFPIKDATKSFNYYLTAAKQKNETALNAMRAIVEQHENDHLKFELAHIDLEVFDNWLIALSYLKGLADSGFSNGANRLNELTSSNPEYAYCIGQLYEKELNLKLAFKYYAIAMLNRHELSREIVTSAVNDGSSEAQYAVGFYYHRSKDKIKKCIDWCMLAAEQQHEEAMAYLLNTTFSADNYLRIARKYDDGYGVKKNTSSAIEFYKKACALFHKDAAIRLAQYHQPNFNANSTLDDSLEKNYQTSFDYYLIAAKQKDKSALEAMVNIVKCSNDNMLQLRLGDVYLTVFEEPVLALTCFKNMADSNHEEGFKQLKMLTENPEYAYIVAKLYEEETRTVNNLQIAAYYYALSFHYSESDIYRESVQRELNRVLHSKEMSEKELIDMGDLFYLGKNGIPQNYSQALLCYEQACTKNSAIAHYCIGVMYENAYGVEKNIITAVQYFQLAEDKGHVIAKIKLDALLNSDKRTPLELTTLALMYLNGCYGIIKNYSRVAMLYQKASELGDDLAALQLGHFRQLDHEGLPRDSHLAFQSYLRAATLLNQDALIPLERLGEEGSAEDQLELSHLYGSLFHDQGKCEYWRTKAMEIEQFDFEI